MAKGKKQTALAQLLVKNESLIISRIESKNGVEYTLKKFNDEANKKPVFLSDVFSELPHGVIYKEETGMGATTLELEAQRNSIIVEPIKITASSKARAKGALYVGSPTKYHKKKSASFKEIQAYGNNSTIPFKKIVVVADSLPKVIKALGPDVFKDYFLLIDEIDSFQLDSTFRKSMDTAIDLYKQFDYEKRAMLSATQIAFSDPELKKERITEIKYDQPYKRKVSVITTDIINLQGVVVDFIEHLLQRFPKEKIFVAYNSVSGCLNIAEHLVKHSFIPESEVKILCSAASAGRADKYYHELDSDLLPARVNLFTSAYFTGYDLHEKYHLVSVSSSRRKMSSLSDSKLKQVEGRCRPKVYSETIIHDVAINSSADEELTETDLIEAAVHQADAMNCTRNHYKKSPVLKMILSDFSGKMIKFLEEKTFIYARENSEGKFVISYLNIDATLEANRVKKELYSKPDALHNALKAAGNQVKQIVKGSDTKVVTSTLLSINKEKEIDQILKKLSKLTSYAEIESLAAEPKLTLIQKPIVKDYKQLFRYVDGGQMLSIIKASLQGKRDNRQYNNLIRSALFHVFPKGHLAVDRLDYHFPVEVGKKGSKAIRERLSAKVIKIRMDMYLSELGIQTPPKDAIQALKTLKLLRKVSKQTDKSTGEIFYVVTGVNPLKVPVQKTMPATRAEQMVTTLFAY